MIKEFQQGAWEESIGKGGKFCGFRLIVNADSGRR
jgi:hypothetical protein